ncbi:LOW QUALITY PROTEIN: polyamine-modulated factor 1-binding protein 1 [Alligator sinensis]|uniref:LOW QUALITY PROTEIN: polyamine-modulated factor 1-binding protein 1 n=1 Tax=Alligator sinensis TaxID=38654 RepID=A0A3Q0FL20_ALLSI|nr:LOW QUALITY PROTEIN: polyamine-modulated factor 1-binding protein 1 [Alligator sinensis]
MQQALRKERRQQQCRADELQEQLQHATERASALELAGAVLQQQLNSSQRALRDQEQQSQSLQHHRSQLETEAQELREQLRQCQAQLQGAQQQAKHHEAALGQLQEALQAAEARAGQSQVAAMETARELQQARASSQQELAAALGQVWKRPLHPHQPRARAQQTGASSTHVPSRGAPRSSLHPPMHAHTLLRRAHALGPVTPLLHALGPPGLGLGRAVLVPRAVSLLQADVLRSSLEAARADSQRLQRESELVLADVRQWATEQKRANERLGQKLREQSKELVRLTGEREHLQETLVQLQQQNKHIAATAQQQRITCERLRALQDCSVDAGVLLHSPWLPLPGED